MGRSVICDNCGQVLDVASAYCTTCGGDVLVPATKARLAEELVRAQARSQAPAVAPPPSTTTPTPAPPAPPPPPPPPGRPAQPAGGSATATMTALAPTAVAMSRSLASGLPWQTVVGNQVPDLKAMLARTAAPVAQRAVRRSLRSPGLALLATTALDLLVVVITGGVGALSSAVPRATAGALTSLLSIAVGGKGGTLRGLAGLAGLGTAALQVFSLGSALMGALDTGDLVTVAPMALAMASALTTAVKTAAVAFRGK